MHPDLLTNHGGHRVSCPNCIDITEMGDIRRRLECSGMCTEGSWWRCCGCDARFASRLDADDHAQLCGYRYTHETLERLVTDTQVAAAVRGLLQIEAETA